jgi:hypothetical protein
MTTTAKKNLLTFFTCLLMLSGYARHGGTEGYKTAFGVRGGPLYGLTFKDFVSPHIAMELIAGQEWKGYSMTALFEYEREFLSANSWFWFIGAGVCGGAFQEKYYYPQSVYANNSTYLEAVGAAAIIGIEYRVHVIPLSISLDFKPYYLYPASRNPYDGALSLRYIFK